MSNSNYKQISTLISDTEIECINIYSADKVIVTKKNKTECVIDKIFASQEDYHLLIKEIVENNGAEQLSQFPVWKVSDKSSYADCILVITVSSPDVTETGEYSVMLRKISLKGLAI